jgi:hypothetical protein
MTAYSLVLMAICSLQLVVPPVLPVFTVSPVAGRAAFEVTPNPRQWESRNTDSLGRLFSWFFELYITRFDASLHTVSPRTGRLLPRTGHAASDFCVEDPISPDLNVGGGVSYEALCMVEKELRRGHDLLGKCVGGTSTGLFERVCGIPVPVEGADAATTVVELLACLIRSGDMNGQTLRFLANAVRARPDLLVGSPRVTLRKLCALREGLVSVEDGRRVVKAELEAHEGRRALLSAASVPGHVSFMKRLPLAGNSLNQVWTLSEPNKNRIH